MPPAPRSRPSRISTRRPYGTQALREAIAADFTRRFGVPVDRRRAGHGLLRLHRSDDGGDDGLHRSRRRGDRLRAVLRELRPRCDPRRRAAEVRAPARARLALRSRRTEAARSTTARAQSSSTRRTIPPARCSRATSCRSSPSCASAGTCSRSPTRSTTASCSPDIRTCRWRRCPGMAERTVTTNGLSKTYSVTGWRIGWAISPPALTGGIRKMHDFLTVAAPTPFHDAGVAALSLPDTFLHAAGRGLSGKARSDARHPAAARFHQLSARRARIT